MIFKRNLNSSGGFSLPEVMIAMGLLGAIALGVTKMMETSNKAAKNIENKDEITHMTREIADILANPNNCEETLRDKASDNDVYFIKQVNKLTSEKVTVARFSPVPATTPNTKVVVESMKVRNVSDNGSDGSQGIATLEINFRKPKGDQLGGKVIKKEISLNASLCNRNQIILSSYAAVVSACTGAGKKLIEAPYQWPATTGSWYGVCQDCTVAGANKIRFCQSQAMTGVDVGAVSKLTCINMGGTFDDATQKCDLGSAAVKASCEILGGVFDATNVKCLMGSGVTNLQEKLCAFEVAFLQTTPLGGNTTLCNPLQQVTGTALANNVHTRNDCTSLGGTVMTDSATGKGFCRFMASSCPTGWIQYNGWSNWNTETFYGASQGYRSLCGHSCPGTNCTVSGVSFAAYAARPQCNIGNCSFDCGTCCTRTTTWETKYANRTQIGCY